MMLGMYSITVWNGLFQRFAHLKSNISIGFAFFMGMLLFVLLIIWDIYCVAYKCVFNCLASNTVQLCLMESFFEKEVKA